LILVGTMKGQEGWAIGGSPGGEILDGTSLDGAVVWCCPRERRRRGDAAREAARGCVAPTVEGGGAEIQEAAGEGGGLEMRSCHGGRRWGGEVVPPEKKAGRRC
jgi:hypothetical protein